ncbi:MAG TPA: hypothetical protein VIF35_23335 [Streptosporangiaceae bacterium]
MSAAAPSAHIGALAIATLLSWLCTAAIGAYMLRSLIIHGALRRQRSVRDGLSPRVLYAHFSLALSGLVVWAVFLATGWGPLSWAAVVLLAPAIGLGICTVTLWTPYPRPAGEPGPSPAGPPPASPGPAGPGQPGHPEPGHHAAGRGPRRAGLFPPPADDAVRGRVTDATLARALTDQALAARLIDEVIASLPADGTKRDRKPRVYPVAVIPLGHGLGAMATFVMAVVTAIGAR